MGRGPPPKRRGAGGLEALGTRALHRLPLPVRADIGPAPGGHGGRARSSPAAGPERWCPESYYTALSAILFAIGVVGVVIRRNPLVIFMSIELMLNAANLALVAFGHRLGNLEGQVLVFFVMAVAAAEVAVGLAIIVAIFRLRTRLSVDDLSLMRW